MHAVSALSRQMYIDIESFVIIVVIKTELFCSTLLTRTSEHQSEVPASVGLLFAVALSVYTFWLTASLTIIIENAAYECACCL